MRPTFRTFLCLLPFALAAGALYLLAVADLAPLDPQPPPELGSETPWDPGVEEEIKRADQRNERKRQVICALIDRRLTLWEAADHFRTINADRPDKAWDPRPPECTQEEWACRQVISYVDSELAIKRGAPALAEEWVCWLEAQLGEHLLPQQ